MVMWTIHLEGGPKRVNHAAVAIDDCIFSFGGYCTGEDYSTTKPIDVHMLYTLTLQWKLLPLCSSVEDMLVPYQRYGHTTVEYEGNAYLWGGRNDCDGSCNKLFKFDGVTHKWSMPFVSGRIPDARDGHSACVVNHRMYIFAGYEEFAERFCNDMNYLDLKTFTWVSVVVNKEPARWRDFHTATVINNMMVIFGGRSDEGGDQFTNNEFYCNEVVMFDTVSSTWIRPTPPATNAPVGRRSHSAFEYNNCLYVFGGYNGELEKHFNDLHCLDLETMKWTELNVPGKGPCPRRRQCACVVGSKVYFFGGTSPKNTRKDPEFRDPESDLVDRSDLYVLDFEPSLKTLACLAVLKHKLDTSMLPHILRCELSVMSSEHTVSRLHTTNG